MNKKNKLHKALLLSTLTFTQCIGTVSLVQNSVVQTYAEEKNKDVTSQQFLDYIKDRNILILSLKRIRLYITLYKRHNKQNKIKNNS